MVSSRSNRRSRMQDIALAAALAFVPASFALAPAEAIAAQKPKPKKEKAGGAKKPKPIEINKSKPAAKPAAATPAPEPTPPTDVSGLPSSELRGPTRIDFDDRLIQGQTNKSGAVYLFDRKETGISSMVRRRKSFRSLTLGTIFDR